jgi:hypothetical protein
MILRLAYLGYYNWLLFFFQESKDELDEKPKRKLPDPEKFVKKSTPPMPNQSNLLANPNKSISSPSPALDTNESPWQANISPTGSMPPIQSSGR